jgi:hypothetical protein
MRRTHFDSTTARRLSSIGHIAYRVRLVLLASKREAADLHPSFPYKPLDTAWFTTCDERRL